MDAHDLNGDYRGRVETITPELAVKWLEKVEANRPVLQSGVERIARDIREGRWILTGDPIRFDTNGELIDGQHRLWAVIESNQEIRTYVVRGLPPEAKLVIDTGKKRTLSNYFHIQNEKNAPLLAGIVNITYLWDHVRWQDTRSFPTHSQAARFLDENPQFRDSVTVAQSARSVLHIAPSPMGAAHAINSRVDAEASDQFWQDVIDGTGLEAGDPVLAYTRWALRVLQTRGDRPTSRTQFMAAMKAMDLWRRGRKIKTLSWKIGDQIPEGWL